MLFKKPVKNIEPIPVSLKADISVKFSNTNLFSVSKKQNAPFNVELAFI